MISDRNIPEFSFKKPAIYKIKVQGNLSGNWTDRLGGLQMNVERRKGHASVDINWPNK